MDPQLRQVAFQTKFSATDALAGSVNSWLSKEQGGNNLSFKGSSKELKASEFSQMSKGRKARLLRLKAMAAVQRIKELRNKSKGRSLKIQSFEPGSLPPDRVNVEENMRRMVLNSIKQHREKRCNSMMEIMQDSQS